MFWKVIGVLVAVWLAFTLLGFLVKSLFCLAIIGGVLFLGTAVYGAIRGKKTQAS